MKFICYSFEKSIACGLTFIRMICSWLRTFGISFQIYIQTDWGEEFGGKSIKKLKRLEENFFKPLNVNLLRIRKRRAWENSYVERTHRSDDEEFYIPYLNKVTNLNDFFNYALRWVYTFNRLRFHYGRGMKGSAHFPQLYLIM